MQAKAQTRHQTKEGQQKESPPQDKSNIGCLSVSHVTDLYYICRILIGVLYFRFKWRDKKKSAARKVVAAGGNFFLGGGGGKSSNVGYGPMQLW